MLWLRSILLLFQALFKSKIKDINDITQKPTINTFRVWPNEVDGSHVNNARYLTYMEACRLDFAVRTGLFFDNIKYKWIPVINSQFIRYKRSLRLFEKFQVSTQIIYWDEKWIYIEHRIKRGNKLIAYGYVKVVWLTKKSFIPPVEVLKKKNLSMTKLKKPKIISAMEEYELKTNQYESID